MFSLVVSEKSAIGLEVNSESQALWWVTEKKRLAARLAPSPVSNPAISLIKKDNFYSSTIS